MEEGSGLLYVFQCWGLWSWKRRGLLKEAVARKAILRRSYPSDCSSLKKLLAVWKHFFETNRLINLMSKFSGGFL